ncbi:SDR family NAD(P)-dependent oxidoreductase [Pedosphaera parvula]|uniref:Short-chain dehydrogenase/reductase SDR n=1 Tax=Pedosphaera parvula (strain Ellin514) TaxID=320771 RepID=B9XBA0_PEDPL|nr:glucose 1-dehydrogenase [Pedosphaera parvula]EEF62785.1 short-chain dehydrogenase/reductase SDR [Pedosphaera parvula Ellin514]
MIDLTGKVVLITGAGSGIGAAMAEAFAVAGATLLIADINVPAGEQIVTTLNSSGGTASFIPLDVANEEVCNQVSKKVLETHGQLDVLINNAGVGSVGTILQTTGVELDRLYSVNVRGVFNLTKAFLPSMLDRKYGVIINMASIGGIVGIRDRLAYCTTKFAVVGMTKSMAMDHSHQGIRINCICPGRVETPFVKARIAEYPNPEKAYQEMSSTQLTGKMLRPDEVASAAVYLASDSAASVTGTAFIIDGGWSAGK